MSDRLLRKIAARPELAQGLALRLLQGRTLGGEAARHEYVAFLNTALTEPTVCDCLFCEAKRSGQPLEIL